MNITREEAQSFDWEIKTLEIIIDRIDRKMMVNREAGDDQSNHRTQSLLTEAADRLRVTGGATIVVCNPIKDQSP